MVLPTTGPITAAMVNVELKRAANAAFNLNDAAVRKLAGKTSGTVSFSDLRGKAYEILKTITSTTTAVNAATLFGADWTADVPKRIVINSGVTVGSTAVATAALTIPSTMAGTLEIVNNGAIEGAGGAANGGAGGHAISTSAPITITNNGFIRGGGGGGGKGGAGGNGSFNTTERQPASGDYYTHFSSANSYVWREGDYTHVVWNETNVGNSTKGSFTTGGWTYYRGTWRERTSRYASDNYYYTENYGIYRQRTVTTATTGGAGGNGGRGQGYTVALANGAAGVAGGTNAGTGGKGGNGGNWGANGGSGAAGANGNVTNGAAGASGGAAGRAIHFGTGGSATIEVVGTMSGAYT